MASFMHADSVGTRENLTSSQQRALFRLWQRFFRLCEMPAGSLGGAAANGHPRHPKAARTGHAFEDDHHPSSSSSGEKPPGEEEGGLSANLSRIRSHPSLDAAAPGVTASVTYGKPLQRQSSNVRQIDERGGHIPKDDRVKDELKTLEEAKEMREFLERYGGERLRQIFWDMVKGEHPDAIMLRFLRARKWNVDRAIAVIGSTAAFRADNDVMTILKGGELALTSTRGGMNMLANGISYIYGATSIGEPVYFIEVGNHFSHNQTQQELKQGVIFLQELLQLLMPPPIERKVVIFNMNEFGIRNMDWWCVFFMVKTMESYYVETLSRVYVHGAPWIFKPIWAILKPLLDPVVRDKIRLTFSAEELAEHVPFNHLPKGSMRGGMDWKFEYPVPDPHENDKQLDTETREKLQAEYLAVAREFEAATRELTSLYARLSLMRQGGTTSGRARRTHDLSMSSDEEDPDEGFGVPQGESGPSSVSGSSGDLGASLKARRDVLATKLRVAFLQLRPYIIGKSMVDRWGAIKDDGRIVWQYRSVDGEVEEQVLGLGTTLPELKRNLEMIEQASRQGQGSSDLQYDSMPSTPPQQTQSKVHPSTSPGHGSEMNRRQQRLRNRSRPGSATLDGETSGLDQEPVPAGADEGPSKQADVHSQPKSQQDVTSDEAPNSGVADSINPASSNGATSEHAPPSVPVHPLQVASQDKDQ